MQRHDVVVGSCRCTTFTDEFCKNGYIVEAVQLFFVLWEISSVHSILKPTYSWLIDELCKSSRLEIVWELFHGLLRKGLSPDVITYNTMIYGLCNEGQVGKANDLHFDMEAKGLATDFVIFNSLMYGFIQNNETSKVIELLLKREEKNVMSSIVEDLLVKYEISLNLLPSFPVQE